MMYQLKVSDNNGTSVYGPFNTRAEASKEQTATISAHNYKRSKGFIRHNFPNENRIVFTHAVYSSVIFDIEAI